MRVPLIGIVTASCVLAACDERDPGMVDPATAPSPIERAGQDSVLHAPRVTIGNVVDTPSRYTGQTVRITGEIESMLNPQALVLRASGAIGVESILILTREPATPMGWVLGPGQQAVAVGIVRTADAAAIERELGHQLEPEVEARLIGDTPVVIARAVGRIHGDNVDWTNPAGIRPGPT